MYIYTIIYIYIYIYLSTGSTPGLEGVIAMVDHGTGHKYSSSFQLPASFAGQFTHGCSRTHIDVYDSVDILIYIYIIINYNNEITI